MPAKTKKKFDAVAFMRKQRDRISKETADMDFEQVKEYFSKRLKKRRAKNRIWRLRALREEKLCGKAVSCWPSFVIRYPSSVIRHSLSVIRYPSFVIRLSLSVIRYPSFVIRHSLSVICYPSSVIRHPLSVIRYQSLPKANQRLELTLNKKVTYGFRYVTLII